MTQLVNPKDVQAQADAKPRLDLLEPAADEATAAALAFGASKYGVRNYVGSPIAARVYVAAMRRHLAAWLRGEDVAEDSGVHHLGHIAANCHVALAAIEAGTFIDDRHGRPATDSSEKPDEVEEEDPEVLDFLAGHPSPSEAPESVAEALDQGFTEACRACPDPDQHRFNGGTCDMAEGFSRGYEGCRADCQSRVDEGAGQGE